MKIKLHDVLAVVPLSDEGKIVLKQALNLQRALPFRIFAVNVIQPVSLANKFFGTVSRNELHEKSLQNLTDFIRNFLGGEIPANVIPKVVEGKIVPTLISQARSGNYLFIILKRSRQKTGIANLLVQGELDKIIGHAWCPVLTVKENPSPEVLKEILIPMDISDDTRKKLLWASLFAKTAKAKIRIVSALKKDIDINKSLVLRKSEMIRTMLSERGIVCEVDILKTFNQIKYQMVLEHIEKVNPDFVIIRKHHVASFSGKTIGDFARKIIHGADVPVFTVSQKQSDIEKILLI